MKKKRLAVVQSSYIPWKGYFDLIHSADEFILFDDVQYTRRDWRNRNIVKTAEGPHWLTIPVAAKGKYEAPIKSITVSEARWADAHWKTITTAYGRAPFFKQYEPALRDMYARAGAETHLSAINHIFIEGLCRLLGIETKITWSMDYEVAEGKTARLVSLCRQAGAGVYLSGPTARAYIEETQFVEAGVELVFFDYSGYPEYPQLHPPFDHRVSIVDLLFNTGPDATKYMLTF